MNVSALLEEMRSLDIRLAVDGDELCVSAPAGALTPEACERLRRARDEIVDFLCAAAALARLPPAIVALQPAGERPPLFAVPGHNGDVFCFRELARELGDEQPFFGLQPPGVDGRASPLLSVPALAAYYLPQILAFRPGSRYIVAGYCAGGAVAFELARQLRQHGAEVDFVVLFGSLFPASYRLPARVRGFVAAQAARVRMHWRTLAALASGRGMHGIRDYLAGKWRGRRQRQQAEQAAAADPVMAHRAAVERATLTAVRRYDAGYFPGRLCLLQPNADWCHAAGGPGWLPSLAAQTEEYCGPAGCDGFNMLRPPFAAAFADILRQCREPAAVGISAGVGALADAGPAGAVVGTAAAAPKPVGILARRLLPGRLARLLRKASPEPQGEPS